MTTAQDQQFWSVQLVQGADGQALRTAHYAEHKQRLDAFKERYPGVLVFGGPMMDPDTDAAMGSCFILRRGEAVPDRAAVEAWIDSDVFHQKKYWVERHVALFTAKTNMLDTVSR